MKTLISFLLLLNMTLFVKGDVGSPDIQAVCRITLIDGRSIEGMIVIGNGGYFGVWANGFIIQKPGDSIYYRLVFFDLNFRSLNISDTLISQGYQYGFSNSRLDGKHSVRFMQRSVSKSLSFQVERKLRIDSLIVTRHDECHYQLKDSLKLFFELPRTTYLSYSDGWEKTDNTIVSNTIALNQIAQIELIERPGKIWLEKIATAKKEFNDDNEDSTGDFQPAAWFHEIIFNSELMREKTILLKHCEQYQ